ncbi:MAG TPA: hypothetical protein VK249_23855 [Anaerolineales bacterium]|nr:hypothetical protein [Anaerolineales bacterium]
MNGKNYEGRVNTSDMVERTDRSTNRAAVNSNPFAYKGPVLATLIQESPMGRGIVAFGPKDETIIHETPFGETIPYHVPEVDAITHIAPIGTSSETLAVLLNREESEHFRTLWNEIQVKFVDEPRSAVQQADVLVSEVIEKITQMFSNEHSSLEEQWKQANDVSTEDLRRALQRYRSFFNRLVA